MSTQPEQEIAPSLCGGRYRLEEVLGAGGMAKVYKAFDRRLEVYRAIKILSPAYASHPEIRKRFLAEARTTARLSHPNIVTAHDIGADGDRLFIVMEMLDGGSIWDRMRNSGPLPPARALEVVQALLPALEHAHAMGVIHRDIKPGNILVAKEGMYKLADFGIARVAEAENSTRTGSLLGTPAYMAPEQWNGSKELDGRADLFALAATLYSLVTLATPQDLHIPESQEEQLRQLPEPIRTVIQRGARYRPGDRYESAQEMLDAVNIAYRRLLGQEPITVAPLPDMGRTRPAPSSSDPPRAPSLGSGSGSGASAGTPSGASQGPTLAPLSRIPRFSLLPEDSQPGLAMTDGPLLELDPIGLSGDSRLRTSPSYGASPHLAPPSTGSSPAMGSSGANPGIGRNTGPTTSTPMIEVPEMRHERSSLGMPPPSLPGSTLSGSHPSPLRGNPKTPYTLPALEEDPSEQRRKLLLGAGVLALVLALIGIAVAVMGDAPAPASPERSEQPGVEAGATSLAAPDAVATNPSAPNGAGAGTPEATDPTAGGPDPSVEVPKGPHGEVVVECRPNCTVFMDQRAVGRGRVELPATVGRHTISVGDPGSRVNATVTVSEGQVATFCWDTVAKTRCKI